MRGAKRRKIAAALVLSLVAGGWSDPPPGALSCSGCHPPAAAAAVPFPVLFGRKADEVSALLLAFRDGSRPSTVMGRIARGFDPDELKAIAAWLEAGK